MICRAVIMSLPLLTCGCGLVSPVMEGSQQPHMTAFLVNHVVGHVKCELGREILKEIDDDIALARSRHLKRRLAWLDDWAGTLTLTLQVEEKGTASPSLTYVNPLTGLQMFSLSAGASGTADATRKQQVDYVFNIKKDFLAPEFRGRYEVDGPPICHDEDGKILIEGDLQIRDWLDSALFAYHLPDYVDAQPPDVLTDDITFVVTVSGNVTPTFKLSRFTVDPTNPLLSASRVRTNEALIALGPAKKSPKSSGPSQAVLDFRNIALIGSALNISIRNP